MASGIVARWCWRLGAAAVIAGALAYIPYRVYGSEGYVHYRRLGRQAEALRRQNAALAAENEALARRVQRLRDDPATIRQVARDDLGLVEEGDLVVQIEPPPSGAERAAERGAVSR